MLQWTIGANLLASLALPAFAQQSPAPLPSGVPGGVLTETRTTKLDLGGALLADGD